MRMQTSFTARHWFVRSATRLVVLLVVAVTLPIALAGPVAAAPAVPQLASAPRDAIDNEFVNLINAARATAGVAPVAAHPGLRNLSIWWSSQQADGATNCALAHNPNAWSQLPSYGASNRTAWGENVAKWTTDRFSTQYIFDRYMSSPGHRANILGANYRYVGVGTVSANTACVGNDFNTMTFTDRVDSSAAPQPVTRIALRAVVNGRYVAAENAGSAPLIANRTTPDLWEQFDVINRGGSDVALRSNANNRYVCAENAGAGPLIANRSVIDTWETFQLIRNGDGTVSLRSRANGRLVTAENAGAAPLVANRVAIDVWEKFELIAR